MKDKEILREEMKKLTFYNKLLESEKVSLELFCQHYYSAILDSILEEIGKQIGTHLIKVRDDTYYLGSYDDGISTSTDIIKSYKEN